MLKNRRPQKKINPETHRLKLDFKGLKLVQLHEKEIDIV
jgi:hypothetical protein